MREIMYKKRQSIIHRRKCITIDERAEDKDCKTHVRKNFIYIVRKTKKIKKRFNKPEVHIKKTFDSNTLVEGFSFRVKGSFSMNSGRHFFNVDFCHTLKINIKWKNKIFSPNKSATLT